MLAIQVRILSSLRSVEKPMQKQRIEIRDVGPVQLELGHDQKW